MTLPPELSSAIEIYRNWIDEDLKKEQELNLINETIYHYTNAIGLRGIIESEMVWFTDFRHMNDPSEIVHGIEICRDVVRHLKTGVDSRVSLFLDCLIDLMRLDNFSRALEYFIGSFTRRRDDLGQWRAYADNGKGVAIGLAPHLFGIESTTVVKPNEAAFSSPVVYDLAEVSRRHSKAITRAAQIFFEAANAHRDLLHETTGGIPFLQVFAREVIASPLIWNCLTSKNPAYAHEEEIRLIMLGTHEKLRPYIRTRIRSGEIVPYVPYKLAVRREHSIGEIIVGPAANRDAERTVKTMLESLGVTHDIPITRSLIPYRAI